MEKVLAFCSLVRIPYSLVTMSVALVGALLAASTLNPLQLIPVAVLGLLAHIFGFGLNDILDRTIDARSPTRQTSPLVSNQLTVQQANIFVWIQPILALILVYWISRGGNRWLALLCCTASGFLSVIYNMWSKRGGLRSVIAELSLGGSISLLLLTGGFCFVSALTWDVYLRIVTWGVFLHFVNSVPSGLEDIYIDQVAGAKSFVITFGAKVEEDGILHIPDHLKVYTLGILGIVIVLNLGLLVVSGNYSPFYLGIVFLFATGLHVAGIFLLVLSLNASDIRQLLKLYPLATSYFGFGALLATIIYLAPFVLSAASLLCLLVGIASIGTRSKLRIKSADKILPS